jgi:hypothetical protein
MAKANSVLSTPRRTASKSNPTDQPTTRDDELGMSWWNSLSKQERAKWSAIAGNTGRPKDAWEAFRRGSVDQSPPVDPTRRGFIAVAAGASIISVGSLAAVAMPIAAALPIAAARPAAAAQIIDDAELIQLGAKLEPLVEQYYAARKPWARSLAAAHAERERDFGDDPVRFNEPEVAKAFQDSCEHLGVDEASDTLHSVYEDMEPLMKAINASPVNSIEGLRAKALVAFYEVAPLCAGDTEFSFDDAYPFQQLFTAVAELCGLKGKIAATGYTLPDIGGDDSDDEGEEA